MNKKMIPLVLFSVVVAGLALLGGFSALHSFAAEQAAAQSPAGQPAQDLSQTPAEPDPRWLELVRQRAAGFAVESPSISLLSVNLNLTDYTIAGHAPALTPVTVQVTRGDCLLASGTGFPVPDGQGFFYHVYPERVYPACASDYLITGDIILVSQARQSISLTVPTLTAWADPGQDTVYGSTTPSATIEVDLFPFAEPDTAYTESTAAGPDGRYIVDWTSRRDLLPRDTGYIVFAQDAYRAVYRRFLAPFLRLPVNGSDISGYVTPYSRVIITATQSGSPYAHYYGESGSDGSLRVYQYDWLVPNVNLRPGSEIIGCITERDTGCKDGQLITTTVLNLSAHSSQTEQRVWGNAPIGSAVEVLRFNGPLYDNDAELWSSAPASRVVVTASAAGEYAIALPFEAADFGIVSVANPDGNLTFAHYALASLWVPLGNITASIPPHGQIDPITSPVTVAVTGPSGYLKDIFTNSPTNGSIFRLEPDAGPLPYPPGMIGTKQSVIYESGDSITVTSRRGLESHIVLPTLTAQIDPAHNTVRGKAPPGAVLTVRVNMTPDSTVVVTATAQGDYVADFSAYPPFAFKTSGETVMVTPEGHHIVRSFRLFSSVCPPSIYHIQVNGHYVYINNPECIGAWLRLRSKTGQVKAEISLNYRNEQVYFPDADQEPLQILSGERLEIEYGGQVYATTVPTLTLPLMVGANQIVGQAPPDTNLYLGLGSEQKPIIRSPLLLSDDRGIYTATLPAGYMIKPGTIATLLALDGYPQLSTYSVLPVLTAHLYQRKLDGWLLPFTPFTATITSGKPFTPTHGRSQESGQFNLTYPPPVEPLMPEDQIELLTPDEVMTMTVAPLTAHIDPIASIVTGTAPPGSLMELRLSFAPQPPYFDYDFTRWLTATMSGTFSTNYPANTSVRSATLIHYDAHLFQTSLAFNSPRWEVTLDNNCVRGRAETSGTSIMVYVRPGDGSPAEAVKAFAAEPDGHYTACFERAIQPGDLLTRTAPTEENYFLVPIVTAKHDYARQVVAGLAPPGALIEVYLPDNLMVARHTWSDARGYYGLDTSSLNLRLRQMGYVLYTDPENNAVRKNFRIDGFRFWLPWFGK
jgi:hypothetical protein